MKELNTQLSINRVHCFEGEEDYIIVQVRDVISGITFSSTKVSLVNFALALTALSNVESKTDVIGLKYLGMKYGYKKLIIEIGEKISSIDREKIALTKAKKLCPKGWTISQWLKSQDSFFYKNNRWFANVEIFRYVKTKEDKNVDA